MAGMSQEDLLRPHVSPAPYRAQDFKVSLSV